MIGSLTVFLLSVYYLHAHTALPTTTEPGTIKMISRMIHCLLNSKYHSFCPIGNMWCLSILSLLFLPLSLFLLFKNIYFCLFVLGTYVYTHAMACHFFYHVCSEGKTQVIKPDSRYFFLSIKILSISQIIFGKVDQNPLINHPCYLLSNFYF